MQSLIGLNKKMNLVYDSVRDGAALENLYRCCKNKANSIVVVQTKKGYKFGGYTTKEFAKQG